MCINQKNNLIKDNLFTNIKEITSVASNNLLPLWIYAKINYLITKKCAFLFALAIMIFTSHFANALTASEAMQLNKLDPQTRIEQRCDIEAMNRLGKEKQWRPDKVLAYAFSDPVMSTHTVKAKGAAFRSNGNWYRLSYICKTQDDFLTIKFFDYKIGDLVPRQDWEKHYLVP